MVIVNSRSDISSFWRWAFDRAKGNRGRFGGLRNLYARVVVVDAVPGAFRVGLLYGQRTAARPAMVPDFHWIEKGETDDFETALQELCDASVSGASV